MDCYSVSPTWFLFCCSVSQHIFLKNYLYRIYFFNIELTDNITFPHMFFLFFYFFFFSKLSFFTYIFFQNYFCWFFFTIELVENLFFLFISLKHCSFPHVFFFCFCFLFLHVFFFFFFYPKLTSFFFNSIFFL